MKHTLNITIILLLSYIAAQIVGLSLISLDMEAHEVDGVVHVDYQETAIGPRPPMKGMGAFIYLLIGVGIGTMLILLIIKLSKFTIWKYWFLLASFLAMALALGVIMPSKLALALALILALFKVFRSNIILHNLTEILMYSGIGVFLVPMLDLKWASIMLLAFSAYDAYAVWKSKHMVKMAKFQAESNLFAGITVPYKFEKNHKIKLTEGAKKGKKGTGKLRTAILGGGDLAFPLIFTGAVMEWLVRSGLTKTQALYQSLIVTFFSAAALLLLFYLADKEKFYPAMPFISAGCFLGLAIVWII
ncbi:presenilin family intramembrane aspartyl protease [Nanoarchaeota archaeon]